MDYNVLYLLTDLFRIEPHKASNSSGGEYHSPCPGCGGEDRFIVWIDQNDGVGGYWCRKCSRKDGRRKDNVQFLVDFNGMEYPEAFEYVGRGGEWKKGTRQLKAPGSPGPKWEPNSHPLPVELWQAKAGEFIERTHEQLLKYKEGLKWLESRGISMDTARKYKLGWNPGNGGNDLYRARKGWGVPEQFNESGKPKALWLPAGLVIPCFAGGKIRRIRIRRTKQALKEKGGPKYYVVLGSKSNTMLLGPEREVFVIVEAELDAMAIAQAAGDLVGAVAVGSLAAKPDVETTEKLRSSMCILNALDFDVEGKSSKDGISAIKWWSDQFEQCRRFPVPKGKDPGEAVQAGVDLAEWIKEGLPPVMTIKQPSCPAVAPKSEVIRSQLAPELLELGKLLTQSGACIHNAAAELGIIEPYDLWRQQHWKVFGRISDLVFRTGSVWDYLRNHPAAIITGENFIYEG